MNKTTKIIGGIIIIIIIVLLVIFYKPVPKETVKIGAILPLTGKIASIGNDMRNAIDLGVEEINKEKELVEVIYEDEKCDPKEAVTAYEALKLKNVKIIIGAACSPSTLAIAPIAEQDKVVLITPASGVDKISEAGDYIFRNHIFATQKGSVLARFAGGKFNKIATIYDTGNEGWLVEEQAFVKELEAQNKTVVEREGFPKDATDFRTELTKIKNKNPEAIFLCALMPQSSLILKQMKELNISAWILTDDAVATDKSLATTVGVDLLEGIVFVGSDYSQDTNPTFWNSYTQKFGKNPNIYAAQTYDSLKILTMIIQKDCRRGDSTCIKDALYKVQNYQGVAGLTSFDSNGDAIKPVVIKTIKNGQFVPYEE